MHFGISPLFNMKNTTDVNSINNYLVGATTKVSSLLNSLYSEQLFITGSRKSYKVIFACDCMFQRVMHDENASVC